MKTYKKISETQTVDCRSEKTVSVANTSAFGNIYVQTKTESDFLATINDADERARTQDVLFAISPGESKTFEPDMLTVEIPAPNRAAVISTQPKPVAEPKPVAKKAPATSAKA